MSYTASIKFALVFNVERFDDPAWRADRTLYDPGALKFLPGKTTVPLVVDHDGEQEIGTVHTLKRMEWTEQVPLVFRDRQRQR